MGRKIAVVLDETIQFKESVSAIVEHDTYRVVLTLLLPLLFIPLFLILGLRSLLLLLLLFLSHTMM